MKHQQPAHAEIPATPTQQQHSPASPLADNNSSGSKPHLIAVMKTHGTVVPAALQAVPNALQAVATGQALDSTVQAVQQTAGLAQEKIKQTVQQTSLSVKLLCGAIAGITGTSIIYPMDMVKTRLQNQSRQPTAGGVRYAGGLDCFRSIIRQEGVRGLYRGLPANLIGITPEKAIKLAVNDYAREYLAKRHHYNLVKAGKQSAQSPINPDNLSIPYGMLAGATAGFCQVIATNPMEVIKINTQMAGQHALATGTKPITSWQIAKELGIRGVYRGTPATLLRDVPFSFIFFPLSSYFKSLAAERERAKGNVSGKVPFSAVFSSGIVAGMVAAYSVTPADVIKTRLQTRPAASGQQQVVVKYSGIAHAAKEIYRTEGLKAFFKGGPQRVMIIAPLFGITLLVYEAQQRWFSGKKSEK